MIEYAKDSDATRIDISRIPFSRYGSYVSITAEEHKKPSLRPPGRKREKGDYLSWQCLGNNNLNCKYPLDNIKQLY
jgi:hypothetical protein